MRVAARFVFMTALLGMALASEGCSKDNDICSNCNNTTNNYITQNVGPQGAKIEGPDGLVVTIPAGALTADTELKVGTPADGTFVAPGTTFTLAGKVYAVLPHGQLFAGNVMIYLPDPTSGAGTVWRADNDGAAWTQVGAIVQDTVNGSAYARVDASHFSLYAIGTGGGAPGCNPAAASPECFNNPMGEIMGTPPCSANFTEATLCGGCTFVVTCDDASGCTCSDGKDTMYGSQPGAAATACVDPASFGNWAKQYCKGAGASP